MAKEINLKNLEELITGQYSKDKTRFDFLERENNDFGVNWYDLSMNLNALPYKYDTAIIATGHPGHLRYMLASLKSYRASDSCVIASYDHKYHGWSNYNQASMASFFPRPEHFVMAHCWVFKHPTYDYEKREGTFWNYRYAQGIIRQFDFKYVFCCNCDCVWERPEGLAEIKELLGDADLMAVSSTSTPEKTGCIHTASTIYKIEAFNKILDYQVDLMKYPIMASRSPETLLADAVKEFKLKERIAPIQPLDKNGYVDHYTMFDQDSTWKRILGFHNLDAWHMTVGTNRLEPVPKKFFDFFNNYGYFSGYESQTICKYYETGDRRYLYQYWDQSADSDYDRRNYPLEHYGPEPIYA